MSIEREILPNDFSCFWAKMISTNMQTTFTQTRWRANKIFTCAPTVGCLGFFLRVIVRSQNQAKRAESSIQSGGHKWKDSGDDHWNCKLSFPLPLKVSNMPWDLYFGRGLGWNSCDTRVFELFLFRKPSHLYIASAASEMIWSPLNLFLMFFLWQKSMCWERIPRDWCWRKENVVLIATKFCKLLCSKFICVSVFPWEKKDIKQRRKQIKDKNRQQKKSWGTICLHSSV